MPRLTRTQKYADLRDQLANDKETSFETKDLSAYKERLDNIQGNLNPNANEYISKPAEQFINVTQNPYVEPQTTTNTYSFSEIIQPAQQPTFVEQATPVQPTMQQAPVRPVEPDYTSFKIDEISTDELRADVFNGVIDIEGEEVTKKERDTYLDKTLDAVNSYNVNSGLKTIDEIIENSVNEVRHPEGVSQPVNNTAPVIEDIKKMSDDEFSNTVSLEINQIINQINNEPATPVQPKVAPQAEVKQEAPKVVEEKEVVEIKNINELAAEELHRDTMSETIPFIVNSEDEEELLEDGDEEEGSNTLLNVILIVLIIILVAVLGLIVFYILKTKGIL